MLITSHQQVLYHHLITHFYSYTERENKPSYFFFKSKRGTDVKLLQ